MNLRICVIRMGLILFFGVSVWSEDAPIPDGYALVVAAENLMYPNAKTVYTLEFNDGKGRTDHYAMTCYTRDKNQKIIVRLTAPVSVIGDDILMIDQNVWVLDHNSNRVLKIPSNQSFGGSDFSYGDVVRLNWSDNYSIKVAGQTPHTWNLDLVAKDRNAPYFRIALELDKQGGWPVKGVCFAKSGVIVKEMEFGDIRDVGAGRKPQVLTITSPSSPGCVSIMKILQEQPWELPDRMFNKRNLETKMEENR
jgi:outer membrane lipoprotein-sorting protein